MKLLRVVAVPTDGGDPADLRITFDVYCDANDVAQPKFMTFGFMGSAKEDAERFLPFALRTSGVLANGSDTGEPDETEESLNPFGRKMAVGEYLTFSEDGEDTTYRISQVVNLLGENQ